MTTFLIKGILKNFSILKTLHKEQLQLGLRECFGRMKKIDPVEIGEIEWPVEFEFNTIPTLLFKKNFKLITGLPKKEYQILFEYEPRLLKKPITKNGCATESMCLDMSRVISNVKNWLDEQKCESSSSSFLYPKHEESSDTTYTGDSSFYDWLKELVGKQSNEKIK